MDANRIKSLLEKSPMEVAKEVHAGQLYGESQWHFDAHLVPVAQVALQIARTQGIIKIRALQQIEDGAYLHDAPEDTGLSGEIIAFLFDKKLGDLSEILNKNHLDGTRKEKDEYYKWIAQDANAKIIKTADRRMNIFTIPDSPEDKIQKLYDKYCGELDYYKKYDIFPQVIEGVLCRTKILLQKQGKIE